MSIRQLLKSCFGSKSQCNHGRRKGVRHAAAGAVEMLERREMLSATQDVGALRFFTMGTFASSGVQTTTTDPVQVGLIPTGGAGFKPLLASSLGANIDTTSGAQKFVALGDVSVISGSTSQTVASGSNTFAFSDLLGTGAALSSGISTFSVGAEDFTPGKIALNFESGFSDSLHSVANLSGSFDFAALGGDGFSLNGTTSYVQAGVGNQLHVAIGNSPALRTDFTVGGLKFKGNLSGVQYNPTTDTLTLQGIVRSHFAATPLQSQSEPPEVQALQLVKGNCSCSISQRHLTSKSALRVSSRAT